MRAFTSILLGLAIAAVGCGGKTSIEQSRANGDNATGSTESGSAAVSGSDGSAIDDGTCAGGTWHPFADVTLPAGIDFVELRGFGGGGLFASYGASCASGEQVVRCRDDLATIEARIDATRGPNYEGAMQPVTTASVYGGTFSGVALATSGDTVRELSQSDLVAMFVPVKTLGEAMLVAALTRHTIDCGADGAQALPDGSFAVPVYGCVVEGVMGVRPVDVTSDGAVGAYDGKPVPAEICGGG
jgi:hypothetical protein